MFIYVLIRPFLTEFCWKEIVYAFVCSIWFWLLVWFTVSTITRWRTKQRETFHIFWFFLFFCGGWSIFKCGSLILVIDLQKALHGSSTRALSSNKSTENETGNLSASHRLSIIIVKIIKYNFCDDFFSLVRVFCGQGRPTTVEWSVVLHTQQCYCENFKSSFMEDRWKRYYISATRRSSGVSVLLVSQSSAPSLSLFSLSLSPPRLRRHRAFYM